MENAAIIPHTGGIYHCGNDWSIPERTIPDFDFWYVADGRGSVIIEGNEYPAGPGDLFLFRPGRKHGASQHLPHRLTVYALHFEALVRDAVELFNLVRLPDRMALPTHESWIGHLEQAAAEIGGAAPGATTAAAHHTALFFIALIRWLRANGALPEPSLPFTTDERVLRVIEYITDNLRNKFSVADMAAALNISESLLFKTINAATSFSPNALANRIRVNTAGRLLKNRRTTVAEASRAVGIEDEAYFSRLFKKQTGLSPKQYQLQINEVTI